MSEHCNCGHDHEHEHEHFHMEDMSKYDQVLSQYETHLDDADVAAKVARLIEEKVPENDTLEVK